MKRSRDASEEASVAPLYDALARIRYKACMRSFGAPSLDRSHQRQHDNTMSISPPPLTRKRTSSGASTLLPTRPSLVSDEAKRSLVRLPGLPRGERELVSQSLHRSPLSSATPNPPPTDGHGPSASCKFNAATTSKLGPRSDPPRKLTCRTCNKSSATKYDPMIICPSCRRPYHDSCRMPALRDGLDLNAWKCWKCLDSRPKRKSMADPVLDTSAVSMKMPIARSDRLTAPKEIGASVDQGFLRRLPSFATILGSSKGLHASGRSRHEQPTVDSDLCPDLEIPVSKETVQRETVTHVASSEESECNRSRLSETLGDLVLSAQMDNNRGANRSIGTPTEPTDAPKLTEVSKSPQEKRSKAHNFHSQRSNQSDSPIFSAEHHDCATDNIPINKETEVSTIHLTVKGPAPCPVSCSTCGQQTVKEGWKNLEWYQLPVADKLPLLNEHSPRCQSRQLSSDAEVLVIPETPNAVNAIPSYRDVRYGDPEPMKYMSRASTPNFMVGLTSTGHSSPRPLLSESDSTKHGALSTSASTKCTNSPPSLSDGNFQKTSPDYEESSKYLPEKGASRSTEPDDAAETPLDRCEFDKTSMNNGIPEELSGVAASPSGAVLSEALLSRGSIHETDGGVPVVGSLPIGRDGAWSIATDVDVEGELALKSVVEELRLTKPPPAEPCNSAQLPCEGKVSSALVVRTASDLPHRRKFTNRERARMALVAARGKRLTTAEIVDWNMQMFSHLREKRGTLERNIGAALSVFPEFDGKKVAKTHGRKQLWGFSNASWRDRYEREYAEYCMPSDNLTSRHRETPLRSMTVTDKVSTYTTPTLAEPGPTHKDAIAAGLKDCEVSLLKSPSIYKSPQTPSLGDLSKGRLFEEPPMRRISPEETMTQAEIDQKVLEIKQRPSRKRFFGSDHRLAHVRRYGRQDIHDERGAAEEPRLHKKFKRTTTAFASTGGTPEYGKEVTAIRELFSLPENAIPMNAGQAELAFRDGTLVGGKLPRSRHIHRVGKMVAGELTIRTS